MRVIANSTGMREVVRRMQRAARADCPVVLWGEEGSGKRFVAEQIHRHSRRSGGPLIVVRLPSPFLFPKERACQLEDELLFGSPEHPGRLAEAAGGTLLVDEITRLSPTTQAKLLAPAEGRGVFTGNGAFTQTLDFRLMATTRFELAECVKRGMLREDLYYRIGAVVIRVPPLRERRDDLAELIEEWLVPLSAERGLAVPAVEPDFVQAAVEYSWPGNVAQLRELLAAMLSAGGGYPLSGHGFRRALAGTGKCTPGTQAFPQVVPLESLERAAVLHALEVHEGNRTQAAKSLGISVRTLQRKLRRWQVGSDG